MIIEILFFPLFFCRYVEYYIDMSGYSLCRHNCRQTLCRPQHYYSPCYLHLSSPDTLHSNWLVLTLPICLFTFFTIIKSSILDRSSLMGKKIRSGPYFIKVKIILSLKFKINLIFYLIKESMKHSCLNFFYEIVNTICIKVKRNWNLTNLPRLKDD